MGHPIKYRTAQTRFDLLVGQDPRPQLVADELFIAIHLRFSQRAAMIATGFFHPLRPFRRIARMISSRANGGALVLPFW